MSDGRPINKYFESHKTTKGGRIIPSQAAMDASGININTLYTQKQTMYEYFMKQRNSGSSYSWGPTQTAFTAATVPNDALNMLNTTSGLTREEKSTLQKIKHSNDPILNTRYGPNEYWGSTDTSAEAFGALADIAKKHPRNHPQ